MLKKLFFPYILFFAGRLGVAVLAFVSDIVLARFVGVQQRGDFYIFLTTVSTLSLILIVGLQNSVTARSASASKNRLPNIALLRRHMVLLIPSLFIAALISWLFPKSLLGTFPIIMFACVSILLVVILIRSFLLGIGADVWYLLLLLADRIFFIIFLMINWKSGSSPDIAYLFSVSAVALMCFIGLKLSRSKYEHNKSVEIPSYKNIVHFAGISFLGNVFFLLNSRAGIYVLSEFNGTTSVSIFMTALLIAQLVQQFPLLISTLVFRDAAKKFDLVVAKKIALLSLLFSAFVSCGVYFFREYLIMTFYGLKYSASIDQIGVLLLSGVLMSPVIIVMNVLLGKGQVYSYAGVFGLGFIINLICCLLLVPYFSINGAAISILVSSTVCLVLSILLLKKNSTQSETVSCRKYFSFIPAIFQSLRSGLLEKY